MNLGTLFSGIGVNGFFDYLMPMPKVLGSLS